MAAEDSKQQVIGYCKLTAVWAGLLTLTALTVWLSRQNLGISRVWASLTIAVCKGGFIIAFFMHIRSEGRLLRWVLFVTLGTLVIFIGFTFFDVLYR